MTTPQLVTVAIPVLNEEAAIGECLDRLRVQTWSSLDIVVADGGSTDTTRAVVAAAVARDPRVRLIDNPRRLQSAGLNSVLDISPGDIVARLDARSFVAPDYIERCAQLLVDNELAVVGGRMVPRRGTTLAARGIALANAAPWGAGPARFHSGGRPGATDTVYLGVFRRAWLKRAGGWDEKLVANEDYELNYRIRHLGGTVWLDPSIEVGYQPRSTFRGLSRQYFRYGRSKAIVLRRYPASVKVRQLIPAGLVIAVASSFLPGLIGHGARFLLCVHLGGVAAGALRLAAPGRDRVAAAGAAFTMHLSWASGLWIGILRGRRSTSLPAGRA